MSRTIIILPLCSFNILTIPQYKWIYLWFILHQLHPTSKICLLIFLQIFTLPAKINVLFLTFKLDFQDEGRKTFWPLMPWHIPQHRLFSFVLFFFCQHWLSLTMNVGYWNPKFCIFPFLLFLVNYIITCTCIYHTLEEIRLDGWKYSNKKQITNTI